MDHVPAAGVGDATGTSSISTLGGWVGLATAVAAWYASFAGLTNFTVGCEVVSVRRLRRTRRANARHDIVEKVIALRSGEVGVKT